MFERFDVGPDQGGGLLVFSKDQATSLVALVVAAIALGRWWLSNKVTPRPVVNPLRVVSPFHYHL